MTQEIKFTTDGKKVVVIGSLNSQEKIVQEIFVIGGSEIPSGEHFVVKSLHDAPAVSWKESELKKLEARYNKESKQYEDELQRLHKSYKERSQELRAKLNYCGLALKNVNEDSFNTLIDYITGEIKWIVIGGYDPKLVPIDEFHQMYEDKLRLISLFGKDDGTFTYAVGDYYDYSGGNKKFHPFINYDDALLKFKELLLSQDVSDSNIKLAASYGFHYPDDKIADYVRKREKTLNEYIASYQEKIDVYKDELEVLQKYTTGNNIK